jgi:hypothetical protein
MRDAAAPSVELKEQKMGIKIIILNKKTYFCTHNCLNY